MTNNNNSPYKEELLKYGLYFDLVERIRTLDRNIIYLYSLSNYLSDYYKTFFGVNNNRCNKSENDTIFDTYSRVLKQIIKDMDLIKRNLRNLYDAMIEESKTLKVITINDDNEKEFVKNSKVESPYISFIKHLWVGGYQLDIKKDRDPYHEIFKDYQNIYISKQHNNLEISINSIDELLLQMRNMIDMEDIDSLRISLGVISKSIASITYSINQSLGGLFIGNIIEQEPSVYPHKDLYMIMTLASFVCRGYDEFLNDLLKHSSIFKNDTKDNNGEGKRSVKDLFYNISGICLRDEDNKDDKENGLKYTIVFGNSTLPEIVDRYKLIYLPITCAYRPRYWTVLAHEVSHSYINGLIYFEDILKDVSVYDVCESKQSARKLLKEVNKYIKSEDDKKCNNNSKDNKKYNFSNHILSLINHSSELISDSTLMNIMCFEEENIVSTQFKLTQISEIVADILGFLLGGYAYIPALASCVITTPLNGLYPSEGKIPYLVRLGVVISIAWKFSKDIKKDEKLRESLENINKNCDTEYIKKFIDYLPISENNNSENNKFDVFKFLDTFEYMINYNIIPDYDFATGSYLYMLGRNLGEVLYDSDVKPLIDEILGCDELPNFGWFKITDNNNDKKYHYVLTNILLNARVIERVYKIISSKSEQDLIKHACSSSESREIYDEIRKIWGRYYDR